jgi:MFS family permease
MSQFRRLAVLIAVAFVDMIGFMIVLPLLPFYALKLNASPEIIGQLIASFSVAQLLAAPLWGRMSDRYGRRPALLIGLSASAAAYVVFGFATSVWLLFLSRIVQGAGGGLTGVAQAYVADSIEPGGSLRRLPPASWLVRRSARSPLISARLRLGCWLRYSVSSTCSLPGNGCRNRIGSATSRQRPSLASLPGMQPGWRCVTRALR